MFNCYGVESGRDNEKNITASGRVDTSTMLNTVGSQVDIPNREIIHGIGVHYGVFQEMGTRFIAPGNFIKDNINNPQSYQEIADAVLGEGFN